MPTSSGSSGTSFLSLWGNKERNFFSSRNRLKYPNKIPHIEWSTRVYIRSFLAQFEFFWKPNSFPDGLLPVVDYVLLLADGRIHLLPGVDRFLLLNGVQ